MTFSAELYWLHFLFSAGNYSLLFPRLRFLWEMIYRAYLADTYQKQSTSDPDEPRPSLDEKCLWLERLEEERRIVGSVLINRVLFQVFPLAKAEKEVADYYRGFWRHLNTYAHPSNPLLEKMIDREGMVLNRFNAEWAKETIDVTTTIFDLICLAVIGRFPECALGVAKSGLAVEYPVTQSILGKVLAR